SLSFPLYAETRAEQGWAVGKSSSRNKMPVSGWAFYLIWLIEAGVVWCMGLSGALSASRKPYCERCDRWADSEEVTRVATLGDTGLPARLKSASDTQQLLAPIPEGQLSDRVLQLIYKIKKCPA